MIGVPSVLVYMLCAQELRCEGVGVFKGRQWMGCQCVSCVLEGDLQQRKSRKGRMMPPRSDTRAPKGSLVPRGQT